MVFLLDKLIEIIMGKLVDEGIKTIASIVNVKREMEALQRNMMNIRHVLVDAESKKIESNSIALWLAELREVLYDAEDLLDDFAVAHEHSTCKVTLRNFFKHFEMKEAYEASTTIRNINSNLRRITSQTSILQLLATLPNAEKKVSRYNSSRITDTCSFQLDSEIVGIDDDATDLVDRITGVSNRAHSLFAITGMGGIGKTTLARKVFNNDLIRKRFDNNIVWVCVSSNRSGEDLLKEILRCFDEKYSESRVTLNELSSKVIKVVKEKRIFIVLDDIWDSDVWEKFLRVPLYAAEKRSRILITTRNQQVAMKMNAAHTHRMTVMNSSDGWSMFCKIVFEENDNGDMNELADVGREIVDNCKGLPLAIKVVGGVLRMTDRTIPAWRRVLSSTTWSMQNFPEDIPQSLLLSYEDLPSHLKRCFIYCSLFPQDFTFYRAILPYMWIAEGFIQKEEGMRMEESAKEYYNELLMRNLLQVTPDSNGSSKCKMHDLLHSLAIFVSQNQYIYVDPKTFIGSSGLIRHRHLWFNVENMNGVSKKIIGQQYVRTLMLSTNTDIELLSGLRRLRVLDIEGKSLQTLPDKYVGNMRQLRFLNISSKEFRRLPDTIENLKNLETLIVSVLESHSLPEGICKLYNLRHLLVSDTLQNMPIGLNNLKKLRILDCFVVNDHTSANLKELKDLSELTDLSIYNLERVVSKEEAEEAAIGKKTSLECLKLHCEAPRPTINDQNSMEIEDNFNKTQKLSIEKIEEVFAGIEIPKNLTELSIDGFFGKELRGHMGWSLLHQVKSLELKNCKSLEQLPFMGNMPKLETLHITNLYAVAKLDSDFVGKLKFPKLQDLHLVGMYSLEMMFDVEIGAFPCLVNLLISRCPKLESLSEGLQNATCLKKVTVRDVYELKSIENLRSISELEITRNSSLRSVKNLPSLKKLDINDCPKLESLGEGLQHATCLKKMTVIHVSKLESIENLSSISELKISSNHSLRSVKNLPSLKKMDIDNCSTLKVIEDVGERSSLSISSDEKTKHQPTWSTNANASEIGHPSTVTESEQIASREENGMPASERDEVKRKRIKVDSMDVDTTQQSAFPAAGAAGSSY